MILCVSVVLTNSRSLEDQGGRESATGDDNLLASAEGSSLELTGVEGLGGANHG